MCQHSYIKRRQQEQLNDECEMGENRNGAAVTDAEQ